MKIVPREEWCLFEPAERTSQGDSGLVLPNEAIGGDVYRVLAVGPGLPGDEKQKWWADHKPTMGARVFVINHGGMMQVRNRAKILYLGRAECVTAEIEGDDLIATPEAGAGILRVVS